MRKGVARSPWVVVSCLIGFVAALLGAQLRVSAAPQDAPVARPVPSSVQPQSSQAEPRVELRTGYPSGSILNTVVLDALPVTMKAAVETPSVGPMRVGVGREIPADIASEIAPANLVWRPVDRGAVAVFTISSTDAAALRAAFFVKTLPPGTEIRFFNQGGSKVFGPFALDDIRRAETAGESGPAGLFWSPVIDGDLVGVELFVPDAVRADEVDFSVPYVSHLMVAPDAQAPALKSLGDSSSCEVDVACNSAWTSVADAVAKISFVRGIDPFTCTGTLMSDRADTRTPYFLTANHCVDSSSVAATVNSYWFWQRTTCGGSTIRSFTQLTGGAQLLAHGVDYSFLRLNNAAPAGALFAGWDPSPVTIGRSVVGIHHPRGDIKKISVGSVVGRLVGYNFPDVGRANYIQVDWASALTEGGSSGSPLFYSSASGKFLIGTLTGGNSTCFGGTDEYSEFADTYLAISPWLEGSSSGSKATMVAPSQGAQLGGATVFFDWNAGFNAQAYWLDVGTSPGSGNLFGRNVGTLTEQTVTNIPVTGGTIYVRLWTQLAGAWQYNDYTYAAPAKATITAPAAGQGLCNAASFTWNTGGGALEYWLDVGTAPGVGNIFGQSVALTTSRSVSGFPSGGALYARLWTRFTSGWYSNDYAYSALACTKGAITSPAPGQLGGSSTTFNWTAGNGATGYWLDVGTTPGQGNIFGQNVGLATSRAVSNIPLTGGTIYVRLFTQLGGVWQWNDYTYSAPAKATLVTPITGSTLCNGTQTFSWNPGAGALEYWLDVGTVSGQGNIFGQNVALTTSRAVTGIPTTGTQFVKLWTRFSSGWVGIDYSFAAASCTKAVMASPAPGTTLTGPTVNFFWTISNGATAYWLDVGTAPGQGNIFGQRIGLPQRQEVGGIPTNGAPVYVRLWSLLGDTWQFNDYTYTASPSSTNAALTNPSSVLSGSTTTFQWNGGASATEYWLDVGTVSGQGNIFGRNVGLATSQLVTGLPTNGSTVFVRLWSKHGGVWDGNSYSFTASSGAVLATLTTPPPGSILSGTAVTFSWNAGAGASAYWLYVGTALGTSDLFNQSMGTSRSVFVSDLPTDGSFIYVRLWTFNTTWNFLDYKLVAGSPISKAVLTSPTAGVMLTGSTVTFSWNAGAGASAYWLDVGSAPGVGNYFGADVGLATSRTVTTLPTNGSPVYVRLWTKLNGVWQSNDYSFTALH